MSTNTKISNLVSSQVPFFVRNDHPNFVVFLEYYYKYLEQNNKNLDVIKNISDYKDIDLSIDPYSEKLYNTFMKILPKEMLADKNMILKNIKDFYRAKGTENAIRFLLQILYGKDAGFYYPKRDIFKASDAKWLIEKSIRVGEVKINGSANSNIVGLNKFKSTRIRGNTSNATAIVETVDIFYENGFLVNELKLSNQVRDFTSGEEIFTKFDEEGQEKTLSGTIFSGIISEVIIVNGGTGYSVGDRAIVESNTGSGAVIQVASVSQGGLKTIGVIKAGAGYQNGNSLLITGGGTGASGANANVLAVSADSVVHPNSYNIVTSTISLEANTLISNSVYSNLNSSNANVTLANALSFFTYANTGPVTRIEVISLGSGYTSVPSLDIVANSAVRSMGILGRMEIVDGGLNYVVGDVIEFEDLSLGGERVFGTGAIANVTQVMANGKISQVKFQQVPGHIIGGSGYTNSRLPKANVVTSTGNGANIVVTTILSDGEELVGFTDDIGRILELSILNRGSGYTTAPTINLSNSGNGTAQVISTILTGVFTYPGRYVNDDSIVSGFSFIQDRDYYQNYSYVIRSSESIEKYRKAIKDLAHPAGMKLFGEYLFEDDNIPLIANGVTTETTTIIGTKTRRTYAVTASGNVVINYTSHGISANSNVTIQFLSGNVYNYSVNTSNSMDGIYMVSNVINADAFHISTNNKLGGLINANSSYLSTSGNVYLGRLI